MVVSNDGKGMKNIWHNFFTGRLSLIEKKLYQYRKAREYLDSIT